MLVARFYIQCLTKLSYYMQRGPKATFEGRLAGPLQRIDCLAWAFPYSLECTYQLKTGFMWYLVGLRKFGALFGRRAGPEQPTVLSGMAHSIICVVHLFICNRFQVVPPILYEMHILAHFRGAQGPHAAERPCQTLIFAYVTLFRVC